MEGIGTPGSPPARRRSAPRAGRDGPSARSADRLSDTDRLILALLDRHRVLTTSQLITLSARPERSVDYRLARLRSASLVERTRPYAAIGSAPFHWWLTRAGARLVGGTSPAPGKGTPNPLFVRHTAVIAGLYVALRQLGSSAGLTALSWARDEECWEDWIHFGQAGRIRPDAYVELEVVVDGEAGRAGAFVEVDFATMDQTRLRAKAARHRRYVRELVWWDRHPCVPALLLVTTSDGRVNRFLAGVEKDRSHRSGRTDPESVEQLVAACAVVTAPEEAVAAPVWRGRRPYDAVFALVAWGAHLSPPGGPRGGG